MDLETIVGAGAAVTLAVIGGAVGAVAGSILSYKYAAHEVPPAKHNPFYWAMGNLATGALGGIAGAVTLGGIGYYVGYLMNPNSGIQFDSIRPQVNMMLNKISEYVPQKYMLPMLSLS